MARRRSKKCRYGKLKNPTGRRVCRRKPRRGSKSRRRHSSSKRRCKYGYKKGTKACRKVRYRRNRRVSKRSQENAMWKAYQAGKL